jgi:alkylation response protein AidB-like acyl-CoA dehydrogenase
MNLDFSTEEKMIKEEAVNFLKKECPYEKVKAIEESEAGYDPKMWKKMADLGWMGLMFPEAYGGDGGKFMDIALIVEAMGSMVVPGPFFSTVIQAGSILLEAGSEEQKKTLIPAIVSGNLILALAQYEENGSYRVSDITLEAKPQSNGGYLLNGRKLFVMNANIANKLIVVAKTGPDQSGLFLVDSGTPGITIHKLPTIALDNNCEVIFDHVAVPPDAMIGDAGCAERVLRKVNAKAAVAKSAEMLGGCKACIDMTVEYAKQRVQYGKPIGGFQVIQHYVSNMIIDYDTNHNYLYQVISKIDQGENFETDAYALKANTNEAYKFISERGVHIHGGIGTTREANPGLFFRRVKADEVICGDTPTFLDAVFEGLMAEV